jgi:hypothetical protein
MISRFVVLGDRAYAVMTNTDPLNNTDSALTFNLEVLRAESASCRLPELSGPTSRGLALGNAR